MEFLDDVMISQTDFGPQLVIKLRGEWKDAAIKFPGGRLNEILLPQVRLAGEVFEKAGIRQHIELVPGKYGLQRINLLDRTGLDLFPSQDSYISHNFPNATFPVAVLPIILRYIRDLEIM